MVDVVIESVLEANELRLELAVRIGNKCEHVCTARFLERAVLVELVENDFGVCILLDVDDDPDLFITV